MRKSSLIYFMCLIVFLQILDGACHVQMYSRSWNRLDGLNESAAMHIHSGSSGKVWFSHGPIDFMSWLDGYKIGSIPSPGRYVPVLENELGELWAMYNKGVQRFESNRWKKYPLPSTHLDLIDFIPLSSGQILLGFKEQISVFDPKSRFLETIIRADDIGWKQFNKIIFSNEGGFWASGDTGLIRFHLKSTQNGKDCSWTKHFFSQDMPYHNLSWIWENDAGKIFGIIQCNDPNQFGIVTWDKNKWHLIYTSGEDIDAVWQGFNQSVWIIKQQALYSLSNIKNEWKEKRIEISYPIRNFEIESNTSFWISTFRSVTRFSPPTWQTPLETHDIRYFVNSITEDNSGNIWFSTKYELLKYDRYQWKRYPYPDDISTYQHGSSDLAVVKNDKIVIRTTNKIILEFDPQSERFSHVAHPENQPIEAIFSRSNGSVWVQVGTREHYRLDLYDGQTFSCFLDLDDQWNIEQLRYIFEENLNRIWFGGMGQERIGLYENGTYRTFGDTYPGDAAMCITQAPSGNLWFSDRNSIFELNGEQWSVVNTNIDQVPSMVVKDDDTVWVATWSGLYCFDGTSWIRITDEDGLPAAEIIKVFEDSNSNIWIGSYGGLSKYFPDADQDPPMTMLQEKNNTYEVSPRGEARFNFSGMDKWKTTESDRLLFSYRIDKSNWSPFIQETKAYFTNLKAGKHTFEVRAMDRNFNIDSTPELISFEVILPWYKQNGFITVLLLCSTLIFGLVILLIYRHIMLHHLVNTQTKDLKSANNQLKKDAIELSQAENKLRSMASELTLVEERERRRIATLLHDRIGHSLAFFKIKLSELCQSLQDYHQNEVRNLLNLTDQTIEDTHSLTFELSPPVLYELGFERAIRWLIDQFETQYSIHFQLHMENKITTLREDLRIMLFQSLRELMINVVKHSQAKEAQIVVKKNKEQIRIRIEDDGIGFSIDQISPEVTSGYGIFNIRQRLKYIGGECVVDSNPGNGTRIELTVPILT